MGNNFLNDAINYIKVGVAVAGAVTQLNSEPNQSSATNEAKYVNQQVFTKSEEEANQKND